MKIILNKTLDPLGSVGEVLEVRDGYARNFLFPKGLAVPATKTNIRVIERTKAKEIAEEKRRHEESQERARRINELTCTLEVQAGEEDKLYGSVSTADLQEALLQQGISVERRDILLKSPIRKLGSTTVEVRCGIHIKATLKLSVIRKT